MKRAVPLLLLLLFSGVLLADASPDPWVHGEGEGAQQLNLYFFWSLRCPHCLDAKPVVERIAGERHWIRLHSLEVSQNRENLLRYVQMARELGQEARSVPAFLYCGKMEVGFDGSGERLTAGLEACYRQLRGEEVDAAPEAGITLPLLGEVRGGETSLLLVTAVIAALDAFNPCAFFVLLFLLSLLVNTRSRRRMLFIGGVFVFFSGLVYFLFMAAWLNLFLLSGMQGILTLAAGVVAVVMAAINIKDFFFPGVGVSLSIPEEKKPGLFQRMRALLQSSSLAALTLGTVALALAANSYELLCTSGLPMVYTRILTLEGLPTLDYYLYLLLYNVIYVIPLLLIVLLFTATLGRRKLRAEEGRLLKLLSGLMMLALGGGLLFAPEVLVSVKAVALAMAGALMLTVLAGVVLHYRQRR